MDSDDAEGVRARRRRRRQRTEDGDGGPHDDDEAQPRARARPHSSHDDEDGLEDALHDGDEHSPVSSPSPQLGSHDEGHESRRLSDSFSPNTSHHSPSLDSPSNPRVSPRLSSPPQTSPPQHTNSSPLLTLPPELLTLIALHLATRLPNLGPPSALLPLLRTCRVLHARLAFSKNAALWGAIGRAKFALPVSPPYSPHPFTASDPWYHEGGADGGGGNLKAAAYALRTHYAALSVLRSGDVYALGAGPALVHAYGMLVSDRWGKAPLGASREGLPPLPEGLGSASGADEDEAEAGGGTVHAKAEGRNRRQLAWAGAREFALRFVRERLYEGRYGEVDSRGGAVAAMGEEWRVGWPRDTEAGAAALWVVWFFEGWDTVRAEPESARRALMALLLPFVVAPFRYPSALCPPHHYSVPLLPSVIEGLNGEQRAITVPTLHGAYPVYALGPPEEAGVRDSRAGGEDEDDVGLGGGEAHPDADNSDERHDEQADEDDDASPARESPPRASPLRRHQAARRPAQDDQGRSRLLIAPPARLLFFARMQAGGRMGVPSLLARDRVEAGQRWANNGGTGPQPIRPTQEDIHEKNARPVVRFERQLPALPMPAPLATATAGPSCATSPPTPPSQAATTADIEAQLAVSFSSSLDQEKEAVGEVGEERWAAHAWRARLCRGYGRRQVRDSTSTSEASMPTSSLASGSAGGARVHGAGREGGDGGRGKAKDTIRDGQGGAAPGRIGRVYELGSFIGLWAGTMLVRLAFLFFAMPPFPPSSSPPSFLPFFCVLLSTIPLLYSRHHVASFCLLHSFSTNASFYLSAPSSPSPSPSLQRANAPQMPSGAQYTALLSTPGGAFTGLVRDDFVTAVRPMYMRIAEHHSFQPHTPVPPPPPDSTTGEEGMSAGWLPHGTRVVPINAHQVEVRVDPSAANINTFEAQFGYADAGDRRGEEKVYVYETVGEGGRVREEAHVEGCVGCVRAKERARWASYPASFEHTSDSKAWPEWDAPAWAGHGFADDEGWEGACDGVQDVVFTGSTDPRHGMAWHHYEYAGRVRPWDGLIGLVMRPRDRTDVRLGTYFISGHLVGRDTFEGTWQIAAEDVLAPSWGGSICLARGEE
ncbi:hypothetical protein FB451DRAFT_1411743 [Mycena latifolia]|nr:hypothetical protein FB451DRAFT_1411743 [Mycena latifolia]